MTEPRQTTPSDLPDEAVLLDVREQHEWDAGHAPNAVHVPLADVPTRLADLPAMDGPLPVICKAGGRSARAAAWLAGQGHEVINVDGGMQAWEAAGKPVVTNDGTPGRTV